MISRIEVGRLCTAVCLTATACSGADVRDGERARTAIPAMTLEEDLRIGSAEGPEAEQFYRITDLTQAATGDIYILDGGNNVVRVFDGSGAFLREIGHEGRGPGEFFEPYRLAVNEDTLVVYDGRIHLFSTSGQVLESKPYDWREDGTIIALSSSPTGWLVTTRSRGWSGMPGDRGPYRDTLAVALLDPSTAQLSDPILKREGQPIYLLGEAGWARTPFLAPEPRIALATDGKLYVTAGDGYHIDVYSATGDLQNAIERPMARRPVTQADFDQAVENEVAPYKARGAQGEAADLVAMIEEDYPRLPRAEYWPVVGRLIAAGNGTFLLERLDLGDDVRTVWECLSADGTALGRFSLPASTVLRWFDGEHVYGVARDELGVETVVRWRLVTEEG